MIGRYTRNEYSCGLKSFLFVFQATVLCDCDRVSGRTAGSGLLVNGTSKHTVFVLYELTKDTVFVFIFYFFSLNDKPRSPYDSL